MQRLVLAILLVGLTAPTAPAQTRELVMLQSDVVKLSNQVEALQKSLDERNAVFLQLIEQVVDQVAAVSETVGQMNGSSDNVRQANETLSGEMRLQISGLRNDLNQISQNIRELGIRLDTISSQLTTANTTRTGLPPATNRFAQAEGDFYSGNYELARLGFREIIQTSPGSPQAAEAQLYIANSFYMEHEYQRAIDEYDILLQTYPDNDKKAEALYKKGLAYTNLNQPQAALTYFRQVVEEYPGSREASLAQDRILEFGTTSP
jgi:tol-pal system protein YbgF